MSIAKVDHAAAVEEFYALTKAIEDLLLSQYKVKIAIIKDLDQLRGIDDHNVFLNVINSIKSHLSVYLNEIFDSNSHLKSHFISLETRLTTNLSLVEGYNPSKFPKITDILENYFELAKILPHHKVKIPLASGNPVVSLMKLPLESLEKVNQELLILTDIYCPSTKNN